MIFDNLFLFNKLNNMGLYDEVIKTKGYLILKHDFDFYSFFKEHFPEDNILFNDIIEDQDPLFWILFPKDKEILCKRKFSHKSICSSQSIIETETYYLNHDIDLTSLGDKEEIIREIINKYSTYGEFIATIFF
jgi:hypothetical protein